MDLSVKVICYLFNNFCTPLTEDISATAPLETNCFCVHEARLRYARYQSAHILTGREIAYSKPAYA